MKIDLHDFFVHYDEENPKHKAAIDELEAKLPPEFLDDQANWVRIFRTKVPKAILDVPWFPQTDNFTDPNRTCNSSCCAMFLEYFKPGTLKGATGDDKYLRKVFSFGDTTDHTAQTRALQSFGLNSEFRNNLGFADLDRELKEQRPIVIGVKHRGSLSYPTGGHMVVVIGKTPQGDYVVNDPYGSWNDRYTGPVTNGKGAVYKVNDLKYRWLCDGPNAGWGRVWKA
jgi:hypothetical protein